MKDYSVQGPLRGLSQEIGQDAEGALQAHRPHRWTLSDKQGADYGYDYSVLLFDSGGLGAQISCHLQLKGTTQEEARLKDGIHLSHQFDRTTLNMWVRDQGPILIAIADLIDDRNPLKASVHYEFVSPYIDEILEGLPDHQATVSIRIRRGNIVHRELDILAEIRAYTDDLQDFRKQKRERLLASGSGTDTATSLQVPRKRLLTEVGPGFTELEKLILELDDPKGLHDALAALRSGDTQLALGFTWEPTEEERENPTPLAGANAYLRSRALEETANSPSKHSLLDIALRALPRSDDVVAAVAQARLESLSLEDGGDPEIGDLLELLKTADGPATRTVTAKLFALRGEYSKAKSLLEGDADARTSLTKAVISILERNWNEAIAETDRLLSTATLLPLHKLSALTMKARAQFQLGIGNAEWPKSGRLEITSAGLPSMVLPHLVDAFNTSTDAMQLAQTLRWPPPVFHLLDVLAITAMLLERMDDVVTLFAALGRAKWHVVDVRETVVKFAMNAERTSLAIELLEKATGSEQFQDEAAVMTVAACKLGQVAKALASVQLLLNRPDTPSQDALTALVAAGIAADAAMLQQPLDSIRRHLDKSDAGKAHLAILNSTILVKNNRLKRSAAISELATQWRDMGRPVPIARHLLINADPTTDGEATLVVELANDLTQRVGGLDAEQWAALAQALITKESYEEAVGQLRIAAARFPNDARIGSLLAISLDATGRVAEAFELFEKLLNEGVLNAPASRYYVNTALRIGFVEKAEEQLRATLAKTEKTSAKLVLLNSLYQLALMGGAEPTQLWGLAVAYGRLADQNNEKQEGIYLQEMMFALIKHSPKEDDEDLLDYLRRRDTYFANFPSSKYLSAVSVKADAAPSAVLDALRRAAGITEQELRQSALTERELNDGKLPVPFSWRPKHFLRNVPDVVSFWELRKTIPLEHRGWHFDAFLNGLPRNTPRDLSDWEPLLSITSLLVLDDCGLLESVIETAPSIVVARATLLTLQNTRNPVSAGRGSVRASRILDTLKANFSKIRFPALMKGEPDDIGAKSWHDEEVAAMAAPARIYFCDDILESLSVCGFTDTDGWRLPSMSTLDYIEWLDRTDRITPEKAAEYAARLIELKISVVISGRILVAAIPPALQVARDHASASQAIDESKTLSTILDGIWSYKKPFGELLSHFAGLVAYLATKGGASDIAVETLWLRWLQAVRLQSEPKLEPASKLKHSFIAIARQVEDPGAIGRLWRNFWKVIELGAAAEVIGDAPDRTGVVLVAGALGAASTGEKSEAVQILSMKLRACLNPGTELDELYKTAYVEGAGSHAKYEIEAKARSNRTSR